MRMYRECNLQYFEPWAGAVDRFKNTKLCDCLHTIVNYIARLDIPKGGYAKIKS